MGDTGLETGGGVDTVDSGVTNFDTDSGLSMDTGDTGGEDYALSSDEYLYINGGGANHCGIDAGYEIQCWGSDSSDMVSDVPKGMFETLDSGGSHACAIAVGGEVECWGRSFEGQLRAPEGDTYTQVAAGAYHSCALDQDGYVSCWGASSEYYDEGQVSDAPEDGGYTYIIAADLYSCALDSDGYPVCWGDDVFGVKDVIFEPFVAISGNYGTVCAVDDDGLLQCWGDGADSLDTPENTFYQFNAGPGHFCGVDDSWGGICWAGDADSAEMMPPDGVQFTMVSAGTYHTCGIRNEDQLVQCWGSDTYGQSTPP